MDPRGTGTLDRVGRRNSGNAAPDRTGEADTHRRPDAALVLIFALFCTLPLAASLTIDVGFPLTLAHVAAVPLAFVVASAWSRRNSLAALLPILPFVVFAAAYAASFAVNVTAPLPEYDWATGRHAPEVRSATKVLWLMGNVGIAMVIAGAVASLRQVPAAITGLLAGASVTATYGLYQTVAESHGFYVPVIPGTEFVPGTPSIWIVPRAAATFLEPSFFGAYLGATVPFAMVFAARSMRTDWKRQSLAVGVLALILAGVAVTFSVAGVMTAAVGGLVLLLLRLGRDARRLLLPSLGATLVVAAVLWTIVPGMTDAALALVGKGRAAADVVTQVPGDDPLDPDGDGTQSEVIERSAVERVATSSAAIAMFRDRPLFGVGPGNFGFWYADYRPAGVDEPDQLLITNNVYAELLAETGIVGTAAFVAAGALLLFTVGRGSRRREGSAQLRAAATASLCAVAASFLTAPSFTVLYQWALIGLAVGLWAIHRGSFARQAPVLTGILPATDRS